MDKVLLVSVIALAVALLSMLVNLALVWKMSDLKHQIEWLEKGPIDDLKYYLTKNMDKVTKLENDSKNAFEIVTNNLKLHGTLLDEMSTKFALLDGRVSEHHKQLEDLGKFAGITTGELRVLEQKIYNSCKPKELPEPEPLTKQISERIEEASLKVNVKTNNFEINRLAERVSVLENKLEEFVNKRHDILVEQNDALNRLSKMEHRVSKLLEGFNTFKGGINRVLDHHMVEVDRRIRNRMIPVEEVVIRKHKPDRKRKDNYYRKPNKQQVIYDEFADDIMK